MLPQVPYSRRKRLTGIFSTSTFSKAWWPAKMPGTPCGELSKKISRDHGIGRLCGARMTASGWRSNFRRSDQFSEFDCRRDIKSMASRSATPGIQPETNSECHRQCNADPNELARYAADGFLRDNSSSKGRMCLGLSCLRRLSVGSLAMPVLAGATRLDVAIRYGGGDVRAGARTLAKRGQRYVSPKGTQVHIREQDR